MAYKNRILVYSTQFMPTGGIESHLQEFCINMKQAGVEIDLVILNSKMLPQTKEMFAAMCNNIYFGTTQRPALRSLYLLLVGLKLCIRKYTSLYTNGQGESIQFFSRLSRFKNWVHHHHTSGDAADQASWGKQYVKALKQANTVIACSTRNAGLMEAFLRRHVSVIACFSRKIMLPHALPKQWTTESRVKFGYYGRLIPEKGIGTICKLSQDTDLKLAEFHIWGEGEAYPLSFFKDYPTVTYHGQFSGRDSLVKVISSIDAFLLLSVHPEGLPISLLEVMSAGLPWLATDKGGIPDIVSDPVSTRIISAQSDYEKIKADLLDFASDIKKGKISRTAQIELYQAKFSAQALVQQWKGVLQIKKK